MKKLLALLIVPGMLAVISGCPSPTSSPPTTTTKTTDTKDTKTTDTKTTDTKTTKDDTKTTKDDKDKPKTHEGKFVSEKDDKLTVMVADKKEEFDVKGITPKVDGKDGKWDEVKKDAKVTVTTEKDKVTKVEAKNEAEKAPEAKATEGKFVGEKDDKLTIMVGDKKEDFDVKGITPKVDGKDGKWDEVKKDAKVTVTTEKDKVTKVEAKNP